MNHALDGNNDAALSICWELRLEPRIGVYRRALVNLLLAQLVPFDQLKYADECLDLIDINIIRQDNGGVLDDDVKNIKSIAEDFSEEFQKKQVQSPNASIVQDSTAGTLTSDPTLQVEASGTSASVSDERHGMEHDSAIVATASTTGIVDADGDGEAGTSGQCKGKIIYVYRSERDGKEDDVVADSSNSVTIEGMLRDDTYAPRVKRS